MTDQTPPENSYDEAFFARRHEATACSAAAMAPVFVELFRPASVVDVGCGAGLWLAAFRAHGVTDLTGVEGAWATPHLRDSRQYGRVVVQDLAKPLTLDRRFDLALSLEVAEHLPAAAAGQFVNDLTKVAPVIIFSAAIPFQRGEGHINEQWPDYWADLFQARDFELAADLRWRFWSDARVSYWYRQNILCFVDGGDRELLRRLRRAERAWRKKVNNVVHPELYLRYVSECSEREREVARLERQVSMLTGELRLRQSEIDARAAEAR